MNDIDTLRDALLIISGQKQCLDNLMGNADVAHQALAALDRLVAELSADAPAKFDAEAILKRLKEPDAPATREKVMQELADEAQVLGLGYDAPAQQTFQERVQPWLMACFGQEISADKVERNHRFLEEALELVQACGCPCEDAHQLVDYVYNRPIGEPHQEVGGVQVTLAALCLANALDMHKAGEDELARIWTKVDKIRAKQAAKPKGSPLPQHVAPAQQTQISDEVREAMMEAEKALTDLVADIRDYERVNNLSPSPGKKDRWQSVTRADTALAKLRSVMK